MQISLPKNFKIALLPLFFLILISFHAYGADAGVVNLTIHTANGTEFTGRETSATVVNTSIEIEFTSISNVSGAHNCTVYRDGSTLTSLATNTSVVNGTLTNITIPFTFPLLNRFNIACDDSESNNSNLNRTFMRDIYINDAPSLLAFSDDSLGARLPVRRNLVFSATINDTGSNRTSTAENDTVSLYVCRTFNMTPGVGCQGGQTFCSQTGQQDGLATCTYPIEASDLGGKSIIAYLFTDDGFINSSFGNLTFYTAGRGIPIQGPGRTGELPPQAQASEQAKSRIAEIFSTRLTEIRAKFKGFFMKLFRRN